MKRKQEQAIKLRTVQHEKDVKQLRRVEAERRKKEAEKLQQIQTKLGNVIPNSTSGAERRTTLAINKRILAEKEREKKLFLDSAPVLETDPEKNKLFDPRVEVPVAARQRRSTFKFVEPGNFFFFFFFFEISLLILFSLYSLYYYYYYYYYYFPSIRETYQTSRQNQTKSQYRRPRSRIRSHQRRRFRRCRDNDDD